MNAEELNRIKRIDIGCGFSEQKYNNCYGIDVNSDCSPDLVHNVDEGLPFSTGSLEFINIDNSLEHFKHPYFVLEECFRCLERNGKMRVVVPNVQYFLTICLGLFYDIDKYFYWYMRLPVKKERSVHYFLFTKHLIKRLAEEIGFKVVKVKGFLYSKEIELLLDKI